ITRQVKKGLFYSFSEKELRNFTLAINKVEALLQGADLYPQILDKGQLERLINRVLSMDFLSENPVLDNLKITNRQIEIGEQPVRCMSLVNTDTVELPDQVSPYTSGRLIEQLGDFPMDNL